MRSEWVTLIVNVVAIRPGECIEIGDRWPERVRDDLIPATIGDPRDTVPVGVVAQFLEKFNEGCFPFELYNRIQVGDPLQDFPIIKARVVTAHGDVGRHPALAQGTNHLGEVGSHVLENEREAYQGGPPLLDLLEDELGIGLVADDFRGESSLTRRRYQIPQAEIVLILEADQEGVQAPGRLESLCMLKSSWFDVIFGVPKDADRETL